MIQFEKVLGKDENNLKAYIGKAYIEIENNADSALDTATKVIELASNTSEPYDESGYKKIVLWWIENSPREQENIEEKLDKIAKTNLDIIKSYEWKELKYEIDEPYKEYTVLYINGEPTGKYKYTGNVATAEWIVDGYTKQLSQIKNMKSYI